MRQSKSRLYLIFYLAGFFSSTMALAQLNRANTPKIKTIDTLFMDTISIRAITISANQIWYAADKNRVGYYDLKTNNRIEKVLHYKGVSLEFRSIAQTKKFIFVLSISNPAVLFKIHKKDFTTQIVYEESHPKVFYDSMQFWNKTDGIAVGDPIENCFSILRTTDGGTTWRKMPCANSPKTVPGEAAFAASNSNIVIKNNKIVIASGGFKSSAFISDDFGESWTEHSTPIVQGKEMTGVFSIDFFSEKIGFAVGGDYEQPNDTSSNKALSIDGGKTWNLSAVNQSFGYSSCVQFNPKRKGKELISVGMSGVYMSKNQGQSWSKLTDDPALFTIRNLSKKSWIAAGKNKLIRITVK